MSDCRIYKGEGGDLAKEVSRGVSQISIVFYFSEDSPLSYYVIVDRTGDRRQGIAFKGSHSKALHLRHT